MQTIATVGYLYFAILFLYTFLIFSPLLQAKVLILPKSNPNRPESKLYRPITRIGSFGLVFKTIFIQLLDNVYNFYHQSNQTKGGGHFFSSSHFALRFHQNLCDTYPFSHSAGKGISALVFTFIHWLENLINWHDTVENCCFTIVFYCQDNRVQAID